MITHGYENYLLLVSLIPKYGSNFVKKKKKSFKENNKSVKIYFAPFQSQFLALNDQVFYLFAIFGKQALDARHFIWLL